MDAFSDADLVGVDILQYPVEFEVSEVNAPSPSAIPLPSFGCQGIDISASMQDTAERSSGRDVPGPQVSGLSTRGPDASKVSRDSSSSRESTSEAPSEDSDVSVGRPATTKKQTRAPRGSVGKAPQERRRRQNMLGAVELCDNVMQVEASSAEDTSDVSVLYDMADKAVSMASFRQTEQVSFPAAASSSQLRVPPPPLPLPPTSSGIDCTPTAPPKYAGDPLLATSGQDLHTELVLSRVVGGAVSVKLKSLQNRVILKAVAEQDIERNMLALVRLCTTAGIQPPPPFELRYLSSVMCQYTGDSTQMFAHVRCLELQAHVYWSFDLREPFVPREDLSAEQRNLYYFAHGSDTPGVEGMIFSRLIAPATIADGPEAVVTIHRQLHGTMIHRSFRPWTE